MTARHLSRLPALLACLAAVALPACGADEEPSGDPIPRSAVAELDRQLTSIENRFEFGDGACADIQNDNVPSVQAILQGLPSGVDQSTRGALRRSFDRLFELARSQCDEDRQPETETTETTPPPPPPPTTETTITTETVPTQTVTTQTAPPPTTSAPPATTQTSGQARGGGSSGGVAAPEGGTQGGEG